MSEVVACFIGVFAWLAFGLSSCSCPHPRQAADVSQRRVRFLLLGMLDEYSSRRLEPDYYLESFYASEATAAERFKTVLREFCVEESLPPHWSITTDEAGHIDFHGKRIAASINESYALNPDDVPGPKGELKSSVVRSVTRADMLLYVTGAYIRYGDSDPTYPKDPKSRRAFFSTANSGSKIRVLKHFLSRLGCTNIRLYDSTEAGTIPTQFFLSFTPTDEVKAATGIRREVTPEEMKARAPNVKRTELPYFDARL